MSTAHPPQDPAPPTVPSETPHVHNDGISYPEDSMQIDPPMGDINLDGFEATATSTVSPSANAQNFEISTGISTESTGADTFTPGAHSKPELSDASIPASDSDIEQEARKEANVEKRDGEVELLKRALDSDGIGNTNTGSEDEDESGQETYPLDEPIKDALMSALDDSFNFTGTYALSETYDLAATPCLVVEGLGPIGLPLSTVEACRLRSVCRRAPFGKGERTIVDTEVRDTWELDPQNFKFANPAWDRWISSVALPKVCEELGVSSTPSPPRAELYKLLLYETGSHFLPHQDTEKAPGMFATIVVVLPSQFTGGEVHVSHGSLHKVFDAAATSAFATTVLSWYTDVMHEVKPVTGGYRLALSYNLVHTSSTLRPALPGAEGPIIRLRSVLQAWACAERTGEEYCGEEPPQKLAYLLNHKYSHANLSFDKLKGTDAAKAVHLREICSELGFVVYLGSLTYRVSGGCINDHGGGGYGYGGWDDEEDEEDVEDLEMDESDETSCSVQLIAGLDGNLVGTEQDLGMEELMADESDFKSLEPDEKEYEGYQGNYGGTLDYFYHRTVLLIIPDSQHVTVVNSLGGTQAAIAGLKGTTSFQPSKGEYELAAIALGSKGADAACTVIDAAIRWKEPYLFRDAIQSCNLINDIKVFGQSRLERAQDVFGFGYIGQFIQNVLNYSTNNGDRLGLIEALCIRPQYVEEHNNFPIGWLDARREEVLRTLKAPTPNDIPFLVEGALGLGGTPYLRDTILPQLVAYNCPQDWWKAFIGALQAREVTDGGAVLVGWVEPVLISASPVFDQYITATAQNSYRFAFIDDIERLAPTQFLINQWSTERRARATERLAAPSLADIPLFTELIRAKKTFLREVLLPRVQGLAFSIEFWTALLEMLVNLSKEKDIVDDNWTSATLASMKQPFEQALSQVASNAERFSMLDRIEHVCLHERLIRDYIVERRQWSLEHLLKPVAGEISQIIRGLSGMGAYHTMLLIQLKKFQCAMDFWQQLITAVHSRSCSMDGKPPFVQQLVELAVSQADIKPAPKPQPVPTYSYHYYGRAVETTPVVFGVIKTLLTLCVSTNNIRTSNSVFDRVINQCTEQEAIETTLVPLVPIITDFLDLHKLPHYTIPFDSFYRRTIARYMHKVLGKKPNPVAVEWKGGQSRCACADCQEINRLLAQPASQFTWRAVQAKRKHVEDKLRGHAGLTMTTIRTGSPHGLKITKSPMLTAIVVWQSRSTAGMKLLRAVGSNDVLRRIWQGEPGGIEAISIQLSGGQLPPSMQSAGVQDPVSQQKRPLVTTPASSSAAPQPPAPIPSRHAPPAVVGSSSGSHVEPFRRQTQNAPPAVVPQKRKAVIEIGPIDLTDD
ncbi:hypothetical protein BD410DRAFT_895742 [Rickenella mellea]|uniref:Fe2OG dioxygenase domain-containing protein n=1 Tax=Rickenella mellea TaxID=50990 RepID=A0A4Y7QEG2_9AGAM|nr:hypothetical protein BD410DRAFT_895742 [Rickenella mellea]